MIHHAPLFERFFGTEPISLVQCIAWIGLGYLPLMALEGVKVARRAGKVDLGSGMTAQWQC